MQLFKPSNELIFDTASDDCERLRKQLQNNALRGIRLDLSDVTHCDSAGLALLIEAKRMCRQYHKQFEMEGMPKAISALAEFCGVEAMLVN